LDDISQWITSGDSQILWLSGPLGCGKTTIAQTTADHFGKSGQLASSFFFDREKEGRNDAKVLFATIASELGGTFRELRKQLEESLEYDPSLLSKSPETQFEKMVIGPFGHIDRRLRKLIVVDALDECRDEETQCRILRLIAGGIKRHQFPFCLLISSRPEPHIRDVLDNELSHFCQKIDLDTLPVDSDIDLYFRARFDGLDDFDYYLGPRTHPWPGEAVLSKLVAHASGQFLYASSIVRSVEDIRYYPSERLKFALGYKGTSVETFKGLDKLYTQVLSKDPEPECLLKILGAIVSLREPPSLTFLVRLLSLGSVQISLSLRWLHSVLHITTNNPIHIRHQSFIDFLQDRARSGLFYIEPVVHHSRIARYCLEVMRNTSDPGHSFGLRHWCYHYSKSGDEELLKNLQTSDLARWIDWSAKQNPRQDDFPLIANRVQAVCGFFFNSVLTLSLSQSQSSSSSRHSQHDRLIRQLLDNCRSKKDLLLILGVLVVSRRPLILSEVVDITGLSEQIVSTTLCQVNPLVHMCSSSLDSQWGIRFDSFASFLTTRRRAGDFFINISAQHTRLTMRCLEVLKDEERYAG
jgi:hypothetical protein